LLRDDGAVVWLNGAEVARSNLPATGEITAGTSALTGVSGAAENTFYTYTIDARDLRTGQNVLAVELHQFGVTSSDLSFDLELRADPDFASTLIGSGTAWRYRDNGVTPPADWTTPAYSDASWSEGLAPLGYGGKGEVTTLGYGTDPQNRFRTTWFRQTFAVSDPALFDALKIELQRDDGATVYLNGTELLRSNLPSGRIDSSTLATFDIAGAAEKAWQVFTVPADALQSGQNVLAVELHQSSPISADLGFDLRLSGLTQATMTYDQWKLVKFGSDATTPSIADENANPDFDAARNVVEYALGLEPRNGIDAVQTQFDIASGRLALRFERNSLASDLSFSVQAADTLEGPWTELARSTGGDPFAPVQPGVMILEIASGAMRGVEVRDALRLDQALEGRRFLRLQISR
jgi:hypothetical protein